MEKKTLWQTIIGTFQGLNNEGSAKRMGAFSITMLIAYLIYCLGDAYENASLAKTPTEVQKMIVHMYPAIVYSLEVTVLIMLGLATIETITSLVKAVKGDVPIGGSKE